MEAATTNTNTTTNDTNPNKRVRTKRYKPRTKPTTNATSESNSNTNTTAAAAATNAPSTPSIRTTISASTTRNTPTSRTAPTPTPSRAVPTPSSSRPAPTTTNTQATQGGKMHDNVKSKNEVVQQGQGHGQGQGQEHAEPHQHAQAQGRGQPKRNRFSRRNRHRDVKSKSEDKEDKDKDKEEQEDVGGPEAMSGSASVEAMSASASVLMKAVNGNGQVGQPTSSLKDSDERHGLVQRKDGPGQQVGVIEKDARHDVVQSREPQPQLQVQSQNPDELAAPAPAPAPITDNNAITTTNADPTTTTTATTTAEAPPAPKVTKPKKPKRPRAVKVQAQKEHFELVMEAAKTVVGILEGAGYSCAVFGSLAARLYGSSRCPKDVDILINNSIPSNNPSSPPSSSSPETPIEEPLSAASLKSLILSLNPRNFYLKLPRDPTAPYRILYYRRAYQGVECKIDVLVPGIMHLPLIPPGREKRIDDIPCVPFALLLAHKLQGWDDHRKAEEAFQRRKQEQDAGDVKKLLGLKHEVAALVDNININKNTLVMEKPDVIRRAIERDEPVQLFKSLGEVNGGGGAGEMWAGCEDMFSDEFRELTRMRVRDFCVEFKGMGEVWRSLGFEVDDAAAVNANGKKGKAKEEDADADVLDEEEEEEED
ncbi:hypothetical protein CVT24_010882 [Panaeolus cyanescens]|uniref:Uncharacterized protein n=1 Tax=Panaeolus cyanescens TaxID=181874 RepID=A0A409YYC2_9AGAR|nr:hypothetical protein CVT24_010882 [Panaeolus cyanescens]